MAQTVAVVFLVVARVVVALVRADRAEMIRRRVESAGPGAVPAAAVVVVLVERPQVQPGQPVRPQPVVMVEPERATTIMAVAAAVAAEDSPAQQAAMVEQGRTGVMTAAAVVVVQRVERCWLSCLRQMT